MFFDDLVAAQEDAFRPRPPGQLGASVRRPPSLRPLLRSTRWPQSAGASDQLSQLAPSLAGKSPGSATPRQASPYGAMGTPPPLVPRRPLHLPVRDALPERATWSVSPQKVDFDAVPAVLVGAQQRRRTTAAPFTPVEPPLLARHQHRLRDGGQLVSVCARQMQLHVEHELPGPVRYATDPQARMRAVLAIRVRAHRRQPQGDLAAILACRPPTTNTISSWPGQCLGCQRSNLSHATHHYTFRHK